MVAIELAREILRRPTRQALLELQGALLALEHSGAAVERALGLADEFHAYLCELESKTTAREYSELASRLDIGAVGLVALENLVGERGRALWQDMALGALGEGLMVAASRQYVKAWRSETEVLHRRAAWVLGAALWRLSGSLRPDLEAEARRQAVHSLLAPLHDPQVPAPQKALLVAYVFQWALWLEVARLAPAAGSP